MRRSTPFSLNLLSRLRVGHPIFQVVRFKLQFEKTVFSQVVMNWKLQNWSQHEFICGDIFFLLPIQLTSSINVFQQTMTPSNRKGLRRWLETVQTFSLHTRFERFIYQKREKLAKKKTLFPGIILRTQIELPDLFTATDIYSHVLLSISFTNSLVTA